MTQRVIYHDIGEVWKNWGSDIWSYTIFRSIIGTIISSVSLLTLRERRWLYALIIGTIVCEALQIFALISLMPFINLVIYSDAGSHWNSTIQSIASFANLNNSQVIIYFGVISCISFVIALTANGILFYYSERFTVVSQQRMASQLFWNILDIEYKWFFNKNTAELVRQIYNDIGIWNREVLRPLIRSAAFIPIICIVLIALLSYSSVPIVLIILFLLFAVLVTFRLLRSRRSLLSMQKRDSCERVVVISTDYLSGIKDIKLGNRSSIFARSFEKNYELMNITNSKLLMISNIPGVIFVGAGPIILIVATMALSITTGSNQRTLDTVTAMLIIFSRLTPAIASLANSISKIGNVSPWIESLRKLLSESKTRRSIGTVPRENMGALGRFGKIASIELREVTFRYNEYSPLVLTGINISMVRGKHYGIIGSSGAGKTTMVDILLYLLDPTDGEVLVNGIKLNDGELYLLRNAIGYVSQKPRFIDGTIQDNIVYGNDLNADLLERCVVQAGLEDYVSALPLGLATELGEQGIMASGGQLQRIAIARSLYKNPQILVFDEATAALDTGVEKQIFDELNKYKSDLIIINISHKQSALSSCDVVYELHKGVLRLAERS